MRPGRPGLAAALMPGGLMLAEAVNRVLCRPLAGFHPRRPISSRIVFRLRVGVHSSMTTWPSSGPTHSLSSSPSKQKPLPAVDSAKPNRLAGRPASVNALSYPRVPRLRRWAQRSWLATNRPET